MENKKIELFSKQFDAFTSEKRYVAIIAGRQSGKSFTGAVWAAKKINEFPQENGAIVAPTYKILHQSTLEKFFQLFPEYRKFFKLQQSIIELPTGGRVFIRSADEPLGLEGMTLSWAWLDEAGAMKRLVWQIIRARTAIKRGQVFITSTPYALNWLYDEFFLKWKNGEDEELQVFTWSSAENPFFDKEFFEKEKQRLSPQEFARNYEGVFTKMSGLVYSLKENQIIQPKEIDNCDAVIGGVDFGFRNPAAIAILKVKDGVYYLVDEWYETEKTNSEIMQAMKIFQEKYNINEWYPDPAEPDRIEEMRRAGFYVKDTNKDIKFGISKLQQLIRENRFFVFENCKNAIDEFNFYHYNEDNKKDEPVKEMDHLMDAIRYAIVGYTPINKIEMIKEYFYYQENLNSPKSFK